MNLRYFLLFVNFIISGFFSAQIKNPVKFQLQVAPDQEIFQAKLTASMEGGWHIYSKDIPEDSGIPTEVKISGDNIVPVGTTVEKGKKHDEFSEAFGTRIVYYSNTVDFIRRFKLKDPSKPATVIMEITYQTCDDRVCLAPNTLSFQQKIAPSAVKDTPLPQNDEELTVKNTAPAADSVTPDVAQIPTISKEETSLKVLKISSLNPEKPLTDCGTKSIAESKSYWNYLFLGFLGGLIALLTPCVFPMIPLTVSFFTKSTLHPTKGRRDAMLYGLFILLIFILLSLPFHIIDGIAGNIFNKIATSVWLNLAFFTIFIFFAGSFFGFYDITLPSSLANRSSRAEEAGGIAGIFFMALTLVIVSFSCTGPILGSLLGSALGGTADIPMLLTVALAGFGLAWAIVFGLLALFPDALRSLPKSGGWMNTVKVVLGFIEVALAFKFLSKADLVTKTFLLKRELFIGIWIAVAVLLVLYLLKKIRFPHDDRSAKISIGRKVLAAVGVGLIIYLAQGLMPSEKPRLQLLSGILPPMNVSYFNNEEQGILDLKAYHDFFEAQKAAQKENKPVLIDFTGYGCENCRKMEEFVWSEPDILHILQNKVILASLYVDDREKLPADLQTSVDMGDGSFKTVGTVGDRWSMFQQLNFNNNSQPHYVLVTPDGQVINPPVSGYMSKDDFKKFLECGINGYKR